MMDRYNGRVQPTNGYRQTVDASHELPFGWPTLKLTPAHGVFHCLCTALRCHFTVFHCLSPRFCCRPGCAGGVYEVDGGDFEAVKRATEACHPLVQVIICYH